MLAKFTVLILTEDKAGWEVVRTIVGKSFQEIDPEANVWPDDLWSRPTEKAARAARGSYWKSTAERDEPDRRELIREITTHLLRPRGFVVFHFDGDEPWSRRGHSENVAKWSRFCVHVAQNIQQHRKDPELVSDTLSRLLRVTPFYCMESWLYLATNSVLAECTSSHGAAHHDVIRALASVTSQIAEVVQPWKAWCLGKTANDRLVHSFPTMEAYELQQSFHETMERMMACADLVEALKSTRRERT